MENDKLNDVWTTVLKDKPFINTYPHTYMHQVCIWSWSRQILLGLEVVSHRRTGHTPWMMVWAPVVPPRTQPRKPDIKIWLVTHVCIHRKSQWPNGVRFSDLSCLCVCTCCVCVWAVRLNGDLALTRETNAKLVLSYFHRPVSHKTQGMLWW